MIHQDLITKDNTDSPKENGQIVITREISDGTIHKGSEPVEKGGTDYNLVGGYSSGKQKDVIRVNMAKMGVIIQNPKDLFTEWSKFYPFSSKHLVMRETQSVFTLSF